jgi:hypothetical protein
VTATARGLQKARAAYGAALVLVPGPVIWLATGQLPSRRARRVAQVLGIRHLIQAALTAAAPEPAVLAAGSMPSMPRRCCCWPRSAGPDAGPP